VTEGVVRRSPCPIMIVDGFCPEFPPRHVLCALDLGETSSETLAHAAALTAKLGTDLLVLHVAGTPAGASCPVESEPRVQSVEKEAENKLSTLLAATGLPTERVRHRVVSGEPFLAIRDAGRENESELMVVGLHAGGVVDRQFLGSTTLRLMRHTDCVLLLVPAPVSAGKDAMEDDGECAVQGRPPTRLEDQAAGPEMEARVEW
jgi:nucleotide-binding universal stress UspA family protein